MLNIYFSWFVCLLADMAIIVMGGKKKKDALNFPLIL